jgi:type VI secretion system secreted protein Hcp
MSGVFLQIPGIDGIGGATNHDKWIPLESMHLAIGRTMTMQTGVKTRTASPTVVSEVQCTKKRDKSSPDLCKLSVKKFEDGKGVKCVIHILEGNNSEPVMQYTLEDTWISGYSVSVHGNVDTTEVFSLNFKNIEMKGGSPQVVSSYDLTTQSPG